MSEKLFFETVTQKQDKYYTEYSPASHNGLFADLTIRFIQSVEINEVIETIEKEAIKWFTKYPIPLITYAVDHYDDLIRLSGIKEEDNLTILKKDGKIEYYWSILKDKDFPQGELSNNILLDTYIDIQYRTQSKVTEDAINSMKPYKYFNKLWVVWMVYIPIAVALLMHNSPDWLARLVLLYSFWKGYSEWWKISGKNKPSEKEKEKEKKELEMSHFYHHCKLNPNKFQELKCENFKNERKKKTLDKFKSL